MGKALSYTWRVAVNVFYVCVVLYVFANINEKSLQIVVAILGLLYVTIRSIAIGQYFTNAPMLIGLVKSIDELKERLGIPRTGTPEEYEAVDAMLRTTTVKTYIDSGFLSLIGLICLFVLFSALQRI
jgi:hypothetical protein